jgi:hypothetical protein
MSEELFYRGLLLGGGHGWLSFAFLLCLFGVFLFRPERIRSPELFRLAWLFFALSIIVPPVLMSCFSFFQFTGSSSFRSPRGMTSLLLTVQGTSGPLLLGLSLIFAFLALSPRSRTRHGESPVKHPLE